MAPLTINLERLKNQINLDESVPFPVSGTIDSANLSGLVSVTNVMDAAFGAVGDGVHDDTTPIQTALNSLSSGGVLYFPAGKYRVTSTLTSRVSNLALVGPAGSLGQWPKVAAPAAVIFTPIGAGGFDFNVAGPGTVFAGPTLSNISFSPPYSTLSSSQVLGATLNISSASSARLAASGTAIVQDRHQLGVFTYTSKTSTQLQGITIISETVPGATYGSASAVTNPSPYGARLARTTDFHVERCTFMHYADTTVNVLLDDAVHSLSGATGLIIDGSANVAQYGAVTHSRFYGCYRGAQEYSTSTRWIGGDFDTNLNGGTPWVGSIGWKGQSSNPCTFHGVTMHGADKLWESDGGVMVGCRYECWQTAAVNLIGGVHVTILPATMNNFQAGAIGTGVILDAASTDNLISVIPATSVAAKYTDAGARNTILDQTAPKMTGLPADWIVLNPNQAAAAGTAINAAITTLGTNGGTIYIPKGTWTLDTAVQINQSGITIQGASPSGTLLQWDASVVPTAIKMADTTQRWGVLRDFRMATTAGSTGQGTAIDGSYFTNFSIERLRVGATGQAPNKGIVFNALGSYYNSVKDVRVTVAGVGSQGLAYTTTSNSNLAQNVRIIGDTNTTGVLVDSHSVLLERIDIESNCAIGIDIAANGHECTLLHCYCEALPGIGLRLANTVQQPLIVGGFYVDSTTTNIQDNGAVKPRFVAPRVQYTTYLQQNAGTATQTPGAVTTVNIPHSVIATPTGISVTPANANARGAPAFYVTADATNITLNFASALTAATSYSWNWIAQV